METVTTHTMVVFNINDAEHRSVLIIRKSFDIKYNLSFNKTFISVSFRLDTFSTECGSWSNSSDHNTCNYHHHHSRQKVEKLSFIGNCNIDLT